MRNLLKKFKKMLNLSEHDEIDAEERLRATLLLLIMKGSDKSLTKAINRRLRKLREQFPKEFKKLLPPDPTQKPTFDPPVKRRR
jgi:hypothetical protein